MTVKQVADFLNELPLGEKSRPGSLRHLAHLAGASGRDAAKYPTKERLISALCAYYCTPNRFKSLWDGLGDAERRIIALHVWANGFEPASYADEVAKKFGMTVKQDNFFSLHTRNGLDKFKEKYAEKSSKLWLLFPKSGDNCLFLDDLRKAVGEMKREYAKVSEELTFLTRENRTNDFISIVRFCNSNKLSTTKSGALSKSSALKLQNYCGYEEFAADMGKTPQDVRTAQELLVTFPLTVLCAIGGLLASAEGKCVPGGKALSLVGLPYAQLVQKLFNAYIRTKNFDEISIMTGITSRRGHRPFEARLNIARELTHCPIGRAVYTDDFERNIRFTNRTFARKNEMHVIGTGGSYYEYVEWQDFEHPLIHRILSFFGALGMIDIAWGEDAQEHWDSGRRVPLAFRVNPLGAYILGMSDRYIAPAAPETKSRGGFTVLPDYTIVVPDSPDRLKHEIFFEKLFSKVSATDEAVVYRLDFGTIVRAIDSGISVADVRAHLSASDRPMPENVARALDDWEKQAGRVRLRQVTLLECDDAALLEEVIRYKGMGELIGEKILAAVVVNGNATKEIKKVIEKNKRFCRDVI